MKERKRLERLIQENRSFLKKYEDALAANKDDFGAKLMIGNLKWHIHDLENQLVAMNSGKGQSSPIGKERMVASGTH